MRRLVFGILDVNLYLDLYAYVVRIFERVKFSFPAKILIGKHYVLEEKNFTKGRPQDTCESNSVNGESVTMYRWLCWRACMLLQDTKIERQNHGFVNLG